MAILETTQAARGTDPDGLQETPPVESAHSLVHYLHVVDYATRHPFRDPHHRRHTKALDRHLWRWSR